MANRCILWNDLRQQTLGRLLLLRAHDRRISLRHDLRLSNLRARALFILIVAIMCAENARRILRLQDIHRMAGVVNDAVWSEIWIRLVEPPLVERFTLGDSGKRSQIGGVHHIRARGIDLAGNFDWTVLRSPFCWWLVSHRVQWCWLHFLSLLSAYKVAGDGEAEVERRKNHASDNPDLLCSLVNHSRKLTVDNFLGCYMMK